MRIIGPPSADRQLVLKRAAEFGATDLFLQEMLPAIWQAAAEHLIDCVGAVAQSLKETGGGRFTGKVSSLAFNTCGLKIRNLGIYGPATDGDEPAAHAQFPSWEVGALAQVHHLRAYAGWPVDPPVLSPRYVWVIGKYRLENFEDLSGKWAPASTYGTELVAIARRLQA